MLKRGQSIFASICLPLFALGTLILVFILYLPSEAVHTVYTVNSTADTNDGTCNAADCTLREAINAANSATGADTIVFNLPPNPTIIVGDINYELPSINDTLTIDGGTAVSLTISGGSRTRIFNIGGGTAVTITTLTITRGVGNFSPGGGIFNSGTLNIFRTALSYNVAYDIGGAIYNSGGTLNIFSSTLSHNSSNIDDGGAIYNSGGTLNIFNSTLSLNTSFNSGGAIYNSGGNIIISDSTFSGNNASYGDGGGVINSSGVITISNSTFSSNVCLNSYSTCYGGGIANEGTLNINNSTFSGNSVDGYPGPSPFGGGIFSGGLLNFRNTIIANSGGGDCTSASITTNISNLVEDGGCRSAFIGDPLLGPLKNNGGPTWTHALSSNSLAIDNGDDAACAAPPVNNLDQRGVTRPLDGDGEGTPICDIGAYEYNGPPPDRSFLPIVHRN